MSVSKRTLMEIASEGSPSEVLEAAARREKMDPEALRRRVASGTAVVPANPAHRALTPLGIGEGLRTKVNANLGSSEGHSGVEEELEKLRFALECGADAVMDLSTGSDAATIRERMLEECPVPLGTVPIYEAALRARERTGAAVELTEEELFGTIERQAEEGVDFMTVHTGICRHTLEGLVRGERLMGMVSRGGALLAAWMLRHDRENPLHARFERLLDIARRHEITLSLGDGLRPGAGADATDACQVGELIELGRQVRLCREAGVQCMVEGPGHVPLKQIAANVLLQKRLCGGAPFYVLGPLPTDVAPGYDHIVSAVGGALAASEGADFLCYVTPAEHLGLPGREDVRAGILAARIAAHIGDLGKGIPGAAEWDLALSKARRDLDWETQERLALDPDAVRAHRSTLTGGEGCTMCGPYCAMRVIREALKEARD
jgi:phosphomethylpyrimidine synthase